MSEPQPLVPNGRTPGGKFGPGNRFGQGNPTLKRVHALRQAAFDAVSAEDMRAIFERLVMQAKAGDVTAAKIVIEHCLGRPVASVKLEVESERGPLVDIERQQRQFLDDPEYARLVMAIEHYELNHGIAPGSAMLEQAEQGLDDWRRRKVAEIASIPAGPPVA